MKVIMTLTFVGADGSVTTVTEDRAVATVKRTTNDITDDVQYGWRILESDRIANAIDDAVTGDESMFANGSTYDGSIGGFIIP